MRIKRGCVVNGTGSPALSRTCGLRDRRAITIGLLDVRTIPYLVPPLEFAAPKNAPKQEHLAFIGVDRIDDLAIARHKQKRLDSRVVDQVAAHRCNSDLVADGN